MSMFPVKNPGGLHQSLGVPAGKKIPAGAMKKALHSKNPKVKAQAVYAENMQKGHTATKRAVNKAIKKSGI
jgi:hypothetical protein